MVPVILLKPLLVWEFGGLHSPGSYYLVETVACVGVWGITQSWFLLSCWNLCLCGSLGDYTVLIPVILLKPLLVWEFGGLHSPGSYYLVETVACVGVWGITQSWFLLSCWNLCLCGSLGDYTVLVPVILLKPLLVWEFGGLHSPGSCYLVETVACVGVWGITQSWFLLSCWNLCLCGSLGDYTVLVPVILLKPLLVWEFGGLHSPGSCYLVETVACVGVWGITPLASVMACCLTAPSHYLNQCWLIISKMLSQFDGAFHDRLGPDLMDCFNSSGIDMKFDGWCAI